MGRALLTVVLGVLLAAVAVVFGATALLLPGAALVVLVVVCVIWTLLAARGRLERRVETSRVVEDESFHVTLDARLLVAAPPGSEISEPLAREPVRLGHWRRRHRLETEAYFPRRGRQVFEPARLIVRDPLGVASRTLRSPPGPEVLVLPRIEPVLASRAGGPAVAALARSSDAGSEEGPRVDFDMLRDARPETPITRIHWPVVARTGTLVELSLLAQVDRHPLVVLDSASPLTSEALDSAVRAAASLCVALARAGGCDLLLPGDRRPSHVDPSLAAWPGLHAHLALVEADGALTLPARIGRGEAVFWVAAAEAEAGGSAIPRGLTSSGAASSFLVVPGLGGDDAEFTVAGCHGRRLGRCARRAA